MAVKKSAIDFASQTRLVLPGSEKAPVGATVGEKPAPPSSTFTVSVLVKRKAPLNTRSLGKETLTRSQFQQRHGADPDAVKKVRAFAKEFGLTGDKNTPAPGRRMVKLTGTVAAMQKAFGVSLSSKQIDGKTYRVREGAIHLPAELADSVEAVLGLDNRPQAKPHFRAHASANISYTPVQIAQLYQFPSGVKATGQTIGIIELGGGYRSADITAYFKALGQTAPKVTAISVDKGKNSPSNGNSADGEVMLDIEVAG